MSDNEKSTDPGLSAAKRPEFRGHEAQEAWTISREGGEAKLSYLKLDRDFAVDELAVVYPILNAIFDPIPIIAEEIDSFVRGRIGSPHATCATHSIAHDLEVNPAACGFPSWAEKKFSAHSILYSKHPQLNQAVFKRFARQTIVGHLLNLIPVLTEVSRRLLLGWKFRLHAASLARITVRDLKKDRLRSFLVFLSSRQANAHRLFLCGPLVKLNCWIKLTNRLLVRPYYDACRGSV
jgi:hypothetical protein